MVVHTSGKDVDYIIDLHNIGLFCSQKTPGQLILNIFDAVAALRDNDVPVISGFHSHMEKECLKILLRGSQPIIVCPARSIKDYRYPTEWKKPIKENRLTMVSDFANDVRRVTTETADHRNHFLINITDHFFIPYAAVGGKTEGLAKEIITMGKPLYTIIHELNENLIALSANPIEDFINMKSRNKS